MKQLKYKPIWVAFFTLTLYNCVGTNEKYTNWEKYQGDSGRNQYSSLKQINKSNVGELEVAWEYKTNDKLRSNSQIQCNPIIVDNVLYGTSPSIKLFALNAATG